MVPSSSPFDRPEREGTGQVGDVGGREGQKDVTGEVTAGGAGARQPQRDPSCQRFALAGKQRCVRRDDHDDRARPRRCAGEVPLEPVTVERVVLEQARSDVVTCGRQLGARSEVRLYEHRDGEGRAP